MSAVQPLCYGCDRKAAVGRMFCSARCAGEYAEELVRGNEENWCPVCQQWSGRQTFDHNLVCGHVSTGITEGMKHADAAAKYRAAIDEAQAHATAPRARKA